MKRVLLALMVVALFAGSTKASVVVSVKIYPGTQELLLSGDDNDEASIRAKIDAYFLAEGIYGVTELYKSDHNEGTSYGTETGLLKDSYTTTFDPPNGPENSDIIWNEGSSFVSAPSYLLVKDGNYDPNWYFFDLQDLKNVDVLVRDESGSETWDRYANYAWDGKATLVLESFFPRVENPDAPPPFLDGSISHVALYGTVGGEIPEPTSLAIWAVIAAGGAAVVARKRRGRWSKANREAILGVIQKG